MAKVDSLFPNNLEKMESAIFEPASAGEEKVGR